MKTTKHFALAALLVLGATLSASTPVLAQSTITLTNTAGSKDRDSGATGQATLTDVAYAYSDSWYTSTLGWEYDFYTGYLTVSCSGLTPGATYRIGPTGESIFGTDYSYVTASDTGIVELARNVTFVGTIREYECVEYYNPETCIWQYRGTWHPDYSLSVARKRPNKKYIEALQGSFPCRY